MTLRLGLVGDGWSARHHLEALERLGRTELVGVVTQTHQTAQSITERWGGRAYDDVESIIDGGRPEAIVVAVPPHRPVALLERLVARRLPFLTEEPLAAADGSGPIRLAEEIACSAAAVQRSENPPSRASINSIRLPNGSRT